VLLTQKRANEWRLSRSAKASEASEGAVGLSRWLGATLLQI